MVISARISLVHMIGFGLTQPMTNLKTNTKTENRGCGKTHPCLEINLMEIIQHYLCDQHTNGGGVYWLSDPVVQSLATKFQNKLNIHNSWHARLKKLLA